MATINRSLTGIAVQWQRNGVSITEGPGGASAAGGTVSGAAGLLPSPSTTAPVTVTITNAQQSDSGTYTAIFTNACGSVTTIPATVTVTPAPCSPSDIAGPNQSTTPDGVLTADDIIVFLDWFFVSDARADIAGDGQTNGADGYFTADDIILFVNRFFSGC